MNMKRDYNSIAEGERYFDKKIDVPIGIGILDISRDIPNHFVRERCFHMTYWMVNQSLKKDLCYYVGFNHSIKILLETSKQQGHKICIIIAQGMMAPRLYKILEKSLIYYKQNKE